jgi:hypothetical protein
MQTEMPDSNPIAWVRMSIGTLAPFVTRIIAKLRKRPGTDVEQWIEEFERLSGSGHSNGWRFDRDEIHERR